MSDADIGHRHFDDERIEELARARLDGEEIEFVPDDCQECEARISAQGRYHSLARLLTRDTRSPEGQPAVEAVRSIRRQSYRRRALGEIAALLTTSPLKARV